MRYYISTILFSFTMWRFHPKKFLNFKFFGDFIQIFPINFLYTWHKVQNFGAILHQTVGKKQTLDLMTLIGAGKNCSSMVLLGDSREELHNYSSKCMIVLHSTHI